MVLGKVDPKLNEKQNNEFMGYVWSGEIRRVRGPIVSEKAPKTQLYAQKLSFFDSKVPCLWQPSSCDEVSLASAS